MLRASRPYLCLLFLMVVGCMRTGERGTGTSREPLHDIITLELTFGAENVSEDFLLVRPWYQGIAIDLAGDVLVVDEDFIKVFDSAGNEQKLLGGPGEGPGEFSRARNIWMSPEGYYTVFGGQFGFTANYFRPDHSYIERVNYMSTRPFMGIMDANDFIPERPEFIFCLGETERNPDQWERTQQLNKVAEEFLAERQYKASLIRLHTDGRYIFAFTNTENDSGHVKVDVFDGDRIEYLCSAWFPFSGDLFIRDGYLYRVNSFYAEETYPMIEKHRIDSRVYGSRR